MSERDKGSEAILAVASIMTALILMVCPGMFFAFFLPGWIALPLMIACAACGPWLMWSVDKMLYGERK